MHLCCLGLVEVMLKMGHGSQMALKTLSGVNGQRDRGRHLNVSIKQVVA